MPTFDTSSPFADRRAFLKNGTLVLAASGLNIQSLRADTRDANDPVATKFGLVTDLHYADKPPTGSRHYRESLGKLEEAAKQFDNDKPEFMVELGDLIDAADSVEMELSYLKRVNKDFSEICTKRHYVLGNHCVYTLTKQEFLGGVEQEKSYYSFDSGGIHFVVLDSCFRSDGMPYGRKNFEWTDANVPDAELEWLEADLRETANMTIVFTHQRLDPKNLYAAKNATQVRQKLEQSGKVLAVFQGHSHENELVGINGIHYCTLVAMVEGQGVENNGYSTVNVAQDGTIRVSGFRKQASYQWNNAT